MSKAFESLRDFSPRKFVLIQLVIQVYLLVVSIICLSVSLHILSQQCEGALTKRALQEGVEALPKRTLAEGVEALQKRALPDGVEALPKRALPKDVEVLPLLDSDGRDIRHRLGVTGAGLLAYSVIQLIQALICVVVHTFCGYIAKPVCIRAHIVATILLFVLGVFSLSEVISLIVSLHSQGSRPLPATATPHCVEEVNHSGLTTWLPAIIPVLLLALISHIVTAVLLLATNLNQSNETSPPRVRLSSIRTPPEPTVPSVRISQAVGVVQNSTDVLRRGRRPRLPSLRSLHVTISGSPLLYEIPLTPHNPATYLRGTQFSSTHPVTARVSPATKDTSARKKKDVTGSVYMKMYENQKTEEELYEPFEFREDFNDIVLLAPGNLK